MIRITTGKYKGRNIHKPKGIRPTQSITRKAIFDILGDINGLSFLELYAGSGAVGIEASSRGAKSVTFVENNSSVFKVLNRNLSFIPSSDYSLIPLDAEKAVVKFFMGEERFDLIFFDPPYAYSKDSLAKKTLQTLAAYDILSPAGLIIAQYPKKESLPERLGVLTLFKLSTYGNTKVSFYGKDASKGNISGDI